MYFGSRHLARSIQLDDHSCAAHCTLMVLRHFGVKASLAAVKKAIKTDAAGTYPGDVQKYLRSRGFAVGRRRDMTYVDVLRALARGALLITDVDTDHVAVVHGASDRYVSIADPSIFRCPTTTIRRGTFNKRWDRSALIITPKV